MLGKKKTIVNIYELSGTKKKHFRSVTIDNKASKVWKALKDGCWSVLETDLEELRSRRVRKGGR